MKNIQIPLTFIALFTMYTLRAQNTLVIGGKTDNIPFLSSRDGACDTIFSISHLGMNPSGIAYDGTYLWCNNFDPPNFIYRFDLDGQFIDSIPNPFSGTAVGDMDFDGTHILICVEQSGFLYKLNPITGAVEAQIDLPKYTPNTADPNNFGIAFDGTYLWHTEYFVPQSNQSILYKLDANTGAVLDTFELADSDLCIKFINGSLYGISPVTQTLHKIDTSNGHYLLSKPWCIGFSLGLNIAKNHVWSSNYNLGANQGRVYQFDSQFLSPTHSVALEPDFSLYPNPVSDQLHLEFADINGEHLRLEILNVLSQKTQTLLDEKVTDSNPSFSFDLGELPSGIYLVKVRSEKAQSLKSFIKI